MKREKSHMTGHEKGHILLISLLVMVVGGIVLAGLFLYLDTSLSFVSRSEAEAISFYTADSGIEEAICWLQQGQVQDEVWECDEGEPQKCERDPYTINQRDVDIEIEEASEYSDQTYKLTSTATNDGNSASTTIVSYVAIETANIPLYASNALVSNDDMKGGSDGYVEGGAIYTGDLDIGGGWTGDDPEQVSEIPA